MISVCVGSSCFLRGANQVIETFENLIFEHRLGKRATLKGNFCMGECTKGVTVNIDERVYPGISVDDAPALFQRHVLEEIQRREREQKEDRGGSPCP